MGLRLLRTGQCAGPSHIQAGQPNTPSQPWQPCTCPGPWLALRRPAGDGPHRLSSTRPCAVHSCDMSTEHNDDRSQVPSSGLSLPAGWCPARRGPSTSFEATSHPPADTSSGTISRRKKKWRSPPQEEAPAPSHSRPTPGAGLGGLLLGPPPTTRPLGSLHLEKATKSSQSPQASWQGSLVTCGAVAVTNSGAREQVGGAHQMNGAGLASAPGLSCGHTEGARTVGGDKPLGRGVPVAVSSRGSTRGSTGWLRLLLSTLTVLPSRPGPALGPPGRVLQHLADTRFRTRTKSKPLPFRNCPPRAKAPGKASSQHAADQHRPPGGAEAPLSWALGSRTLAKKFAFLFLRASRYRSNAHVVRQKAWLDQGPQPGPRAWAPASSRSSRVPTHAPTHSCQAGGAGRQEGPG